MGRLREITEPLALTRSVLDRILLWYDYACMPQRPHADAAVSSPPSSAATVGRCRDRHIDAKRDPSHRVVALVSYDVMVVAAEPGADEASARAVMERCFRGGEVHDEGELDQRIVGFYEDLRAIYPDYPTYGGDLPWAVMPLDTGIDHVFMNIRWSADNAVLDLIQRLAIQHRLVLYDCQDDTIYLPPT